jgi:cobalt-zinc-cadmium efflux system protein
MSLKKSREKKMSNIFGNTCQARPTKRVFLILCLTATYMIAELVGGLMSNSLALIADAGHMFADVAALTLSLFAFILSARSPTERASFGYHRAEVIAALFNGLVLLLVSFFIIKEAIARFFTSSEVESSLMIVVAFGGLIINVIGLFLLHQDRSHNLNIRGAWLHVLSDTLGSIGVLISGFFIYVFNWHMADPIASIVIALLVSYSAIRLIFITLRVLMEHTPEHIDPNDVCEKILSIPDALKVHHLHIWTITSGKEALSVHVVAQEDCNYDRLLRKIRKMLESSFGISHVTVQIERECQEQDKTRCL